MTARAWHETFDGLPQRHERIRIYGGRYHGDEAKFLTTELIPAGQHGRTRLTAVVSIVKPGSVKDNRIVRVLISALRPVSDD